jgi:hypothetical protein
MHRYSAGLQHMHVSMPVAEDCPRDSSARHISNSVSLRRRCNASKVHPLWAYPHPSSCLRQPVHQQLPTCHSVSCSGASPCAARYVLSSGRMASRKSGAATNRSGSRHPRGVWTTSTSNEGSNSICGTKGHNKFNLIACPHTSAQQALPDPELNEYGAVDIASVVYPEQAPKHPTQKAV